MAFQASNYFIDPISSQQVGQQNNALGGGVPYGGMASGVNDFMAGQAQNQYLSNLPGYLGNITQRANNTSQQLKGQLPIDVIQQIQRQAAERGVANGMPDAAGNNNAAYLRALGLNSLQMMQQGSQNLTQSIADTPVSPLWNPMSLYVPERLGQQALAAAQQGRRQGGGGVGINGMPNLNARFAGEGNQSPGNGYGASGPSWGGITPAQGGNYMPPDFYGQPTAPAGNGINYNYDPYGEVDENGVPYADNGNNYDYDPYGEVDGYADMSSPDFNWFE
jgi:hypothetical protein